MKNRSCLTVASEIPSIKPFIAAVKMIKSRGYFLSIHPLSPPPFFGQRPQKSTGEFFFFASYSAFSEVLSGPRNKHTKEPDKNSGLQRNGVKILLQLYEKTLSQIV